MFTYTNKIGLRVIPTDVQVKTQHVNTTSHYENIENAQSG